MAVELGPPGDLRIEELTSILATIIRQPAEKVEDWLIIVKLACDKCGREYCADGPLATLSSRMGTAEDGTTRHQPAFELHLAASFIQSLAEYWDES